jgi:hypothetical protein
MRICWSQHSIAIHEAWHSQLAAHTHCVSWKELKAGAAPWLNPRMCILMVARLIAALNPLVLVRFCCYGCLHTLQRHRANWQCHP